MRTAILEGYSGYEIHYSLDPLRSIWSFKSNRWLEGSDDDGYYLYGLIDDNGKQDNQGLHKWYAMAFIPNPDNLDTVHHLNEDHTDNRLENLMWISKKDHYALHHKSEITRKKMSEALKGKMAGENHPMYGKNHSEETRKKMSEAQPKKLVYQYTKNGELVGVYESISDAARQTGYSLGNISSCCNNKYKREGNNIYKGYVWTH